MISHDKKLLFIHIPKTAGTSVEAQLIDQSSELYSNQWHTRIKSAPLNHLTLQELISNSLVELDTAKNYFKCCFVRNPWSRVISEIRYLGDALAGENYEQKIISLCQIDSYANHIRPQVDFIDNSYGIEMDFVGRFENLEHDFQRLCELAGLNQTLKLDHLNQSRHRPYRDYYSPFTRQLVADKYHQDIERFAYSF